MSVCPICNKRFNKRVHNQKYCDVNCQQEAYKKNHNKAVKKTQTLDDLVRECEVYNKLHGTRYSYGKYTALKRMGKV